MTILKRIKRTVTLAHEGKIVTYEHAGLGFEYLEELLLHPNQPIACGHLRQMFQIDQNNIAMTDFEQMQSNITNSPGYHFLPAELPIESADAKTIGEVKQRLIDLIEEEAELMRYNDYARLEDVRNEKDALLKYLKQILTPLCKPRYLHHQQRNDYSAVKQAIQRALTKLKPDFPKLYLNLTQNLEFGVKVSYKQAA